MKILSINTSNDNICISYLNKNKIITQEERKYRKNSKYILDFIKEIMGNNNIYELNLLIFGYGPGTFMGTRLSSSVIQGLSYPYNIPILKISILHSYIYLLKNYIPKNINNILILYQAYQNKVYSALFRINKGIFIRLSKDKIQNLDEIDINKKIGIIIIIGSNKKIYKNFLSNTKKKINIKIFSINIPKSISILKLGYYIYKGSYFFKIFLDFPLPLYLNKKII